jgi:hypothetical protein
METVDSEVDKSLHLLVSPVCLNLFPLETEMLVDEILIVACVLSEKFH